MELLGFQREKSRQLELSVLEPGLELPSWAELELLGFQREKPAQLELPVLEAGLELPT